MPDPFEDGAGPAERTAGDPPRRGGAGDASRRGGDRPGRSRLAVIAGVLAVLAAGGVADRAGGHVGVPPVAPDRPAPVAAPAAALSSSWFCAGATGTAGGPASGQVVIANDGGTSLSAHVRIVASSGPGRTVVAAVAPHSTIAVAESLSSHPAWVGAIVDLDGGAAAVDQVVQGTLGRAATPCASAGSAQWYFASGETLVNADDVVTLLNPYPTDAVVDFGFTTEQGPESPGDFQGVVVPAGGLVSVDLRSHLRRRQQIATTVHARSGRVVAWDTQVVTRPAKGEALIGAPTDRANPSAADPAAPAPGVVLTLGAPSTGTSWLWPDGETGGGLDERYFIYNPSQQQARVALSLILDQGQAEPFQLTVGPQSVATIVSGSEARIPSGVGHTAALVSTNGVGVVATRTLTGVAPAARRGDGALPGARVTSRDWLVPLASTGADGSLEVLAPGPNPLDVTVYGLDGAAEVALPGLSNLTLPAGERFTIPLATREGYRGAVVVRSSGPVYVESDLAGPQGTTGISLSTGVPLD